MQLKSKLLRLQQLSKTVEKHVGKSQLQQFLDVASLLRVNPTCSPWDYYELGLYQHERGGKAFHNTMGVAMYDKLNLCLNQRADVSLGWDKLLFDIFCHAYRIPCAKTIGFFIPKGQVPKHIPHQLSSEEDVKKFLAEAPMPLFAKPVISRAGYGGFLIKNYCEETHQVTTNKGEKISFTDFMEKTINMPAKYTYDRSRGYIFQRFVEQHPLVSEFTGTTVPSGLRITVLNEKVNPVIHRACWKVTRPGSEKDILDKSAGNNLLTQVNIADGSVSTGIDGILPHGTYHTHHPHTGEAFASFKIPNWDKIVNEVKRASQAAGEMKIQHWDAVIGSYGPIFLELNDEGGVRGFQLHGTPFVDDTFRKFLRKHGNLAKHPKLKNLRIRLVS